jgi:hypothetical protein
MLPARCADIGGPTTQPVHLNDLNPINFYLRGHLKALVYMTPVNDMLSSASKLMDDS